ncbi:DUF4407 domain-containing protein [Micromonospora sp. NPDC020750]|uniref:DUF4407 domain-containing protein n=1 Tax=unclassified Micromonospora TaxID=2617518 RepID=UPI0037B23977
MSGHSIRSFSVTRLLRSLAGAREDILTLVPSERIRYTSLGSVVLITSTFATLSLGLALYYSFGYFNWSIPFIALLWGALILSLDRWLATASAVSAVRQAISRTLSRLALAVLLGVILAEPLLLGIFHTAIEEHVARSRQESVLRLESELRACNGLVADGTPPVPDSPACEGRRLESFGPVLGKLDNLSRTRREAATLQAEIKSISAEASRFQQDAVAECTGKAGESVSGRPGQGPSCMLKRQIADRYAKDSGLSDKQDQLRKLNDSTAALREESGQFLARASESVEGEIETEVARARQSQGKVGIIERLKALGELTAEGGYVAAAEWTLRLTIILIEMLPALMRILMGVTGHDRVVRMLEKENIDSLVAHRATVARDLFRALEERQQDFTFEISGRPEVRG